MANLIIKSSADNLVLQGSDASPAITVGATGTLTFAENVTMSGTANNVGTVTAGTFNSTIGSSASLDHDAEKHAWHRFASSTVDVSSAAVLDYDHVNFQGSRTTESAGTVTVLDAGLYWVSASISSYDTGTTDIDFNLRVNNTLVNGTRLYVNPVSGTLYPSNTGSWAVRLSANDTVHMYGTGKYYGSTSDSMTYFSGFRIGGKS